MRSASPLVLWIAAESLTICTSQHRYDIDRIPPDLLQSARAVVRISDEKFEVKSERRAIYTNRRAVTIFSKDDQKYGELFIWYGGFIELEDLEGTLYDARGNEIRELEDSDTKDYAAFDGFSLYNDTRVRIASLYHHQYPYTVEFTYELEFDGFINWPTWYAQEFNDAVEHSRFEVIVPGDLRYWCNRDSIHPAVQRRGEMQSYLWEARNLPKLSKEVVADIEDATTIVRIAPLMFSVEGHQGSMESWKDFGKWYAALSKGRNILPESAINEIRGLVRPDAALADRVAAVYRFMQSRTRYVSVQLGIGGWQPFDARYVHERGYGDCKALSNYMKSLLEAADVKAFPVLINSGSSRYPMIPEFPSNQFNHVILCVPAGEDSLWLECTSQSMPMGRIGRTNENRHALLITPEGGVVVRTPSSPAHENKQTRTAVVSLDANGDAWANIRTAVTGNQQDRVRQNLSEASPEERARWIVNDLQIPQVNLSTFTVKGLENRDPVVTLDVRVSIAKLASRSGPRLFLRPNLTERMTSPPPNVPVRLSPVRFHYAFIDTDSVYYRLPTGHSAEALPSPVSVQAAFGTFESRVETAGDSGLVFVRTLTIHEPTIPASDYELYRSFFTTVFKADRSQAVFVRRESRSPR